MPDFFRKFAILNQLQCLGGTGVNAGRHIQFVAAITFDCDVLVVVLGNDPERTGHDAGPAADATALFPAHVTVIILIQAAGYAAVEAGRLIAVPAEYRHLDSAGGLHIEPFLGRRGLGDCPQQGFIFGMLNGAGQLTGFTAGAPFRINIYSGHFIVSLPFNFSG